jgi:hypothetical protein
MRYVDSSGLHRRVLKNSFIPAGPVTRTITGPIWGRAVTSNIRKGQHSLSDTAKSSDAPGLSFCFLPTASFQKSEYRAFVDGDVVGLITLD